MSVASTLQTHDFISPYLIIKGKNDFLCFQNSTNEWTILRPCSWVKGCILIFRLEGCSFKSCEKIRVLESDSKGHFLFKIIFINSYHLKLLRFNGIKVSVNFTKISCSLIDISCENFINSFEHRVDAYLNKLSQFNLLTFFWKRAQNDKLLKIAFF